MKVSSRRNFFKYMALLGLVTFNTSPLQAKGTKEQYKYQESPNNGNRCLDCMHFIAQKNECRMIEGYISPNGWCAAFYKDPRKK